MSTISIMSHVTSHYDANSDETCPDYHAAMSSTRPRWLPSLPSPPPFDDSHSHTNVRRLPRPLQRNELYVYTYSLIAATIPIDVLITVDPSSGKPASGKHTFKLSIRVNRIERSLCDPVDLILKIDPRQLNFVVFLFPGKTSFQMGGLWCLRVWLRVNDVDHRLFGEDELWLGKDLDFASIQDALIARHKLTNLREQVYQGFAGNALVNFTVRWRTTNYGTYLYSLEYEAGGVASTLFDDLEMCFDIDPRTITFIIYTVRANAIPAGASHKLRVWMRCPVSTGIDPSVAMPPYNGSFIYQRIWKTDSLKIGSRLDFESLSNRVIMAFPKGGPETVISTAPPTLSPTLHTKMAIFSTTDDKTKELEDFMRRSYR